LPLQNLIKHWHFAEAVDYIRNAFNKFISENKAAAAALGGVATSKAQGIDNLKAMKDTLGALPQFQAMKGKVSASFYY
jgi:syntaxin-binding protein 1